MNVIPFPKGAIPLNIYISSIEKQRITDAIEGRDGIINNGFTYNNRSNNIQVLLKCHDIEDYSLMRSEIYKVVDDVTYISEEHERGKRYKVIASESFIPDRVLRKTATVEIVFDMVELPFSESIGTTQDIQLNGINANAELWGSGMGLIDDPLSHLYTHTGNTFKIYNAGNVSIHPFQQDLKITISNIQDATNGFTLKNNTNGNEFVVNESVTASRTIIIDGPNVTNNGLAFLRSTNKQFIELSPGWNQFQIIGATSAKVEFDFRFYYL